MSSSRPLNTTSTSRGRGARARAAAALLTLLQPGLLAAAPSPPPKALVTTASMAFGRFASAAGGAVTVDINGVRTRSGAVVLLSSSASVARFTIIGMGNDNRLYTLGLPPNGAVVLRAGANAMGVNNFVSNMPPGGMLVKGPQSISVGATLQVGPGQVPGNYSGTFQVTLDYQ